MHNQGFWIIYLTTAGRVLALICGQLMIEQAVWQDTVMLSRARHVLEQTLRAEHFQQVLVYQRNTFDTCRMRSHIKKWSQQGSAVLGAREGREAVLKIDHASRVQSANSARIQWSTSLDRNSQFLYQGKTVPDPGLAQVLQNCFVEHNLKVECQSASGKWFPVSDASSCAKLAIKFPQTREPLDHAVSVNCSRDGSLSGGL